MRARSARRLFWTRHHKSSAPRVGVLSLLMRHLRETSEYPLLAAGAGDRLKVYLDLKDWGALARE
jgi:hypothetical protein